MKSASPPQSETILLSRAERLSGLTLAQLARQVDFPLTQQPKKDKGWIGQLLECALGANASSKPEPDFMGLGIELKTIPVNSLGKPQESTYICSVSINALKQQTWYTSTVFAKLRRVLWIPIETEKNIAFAERRIGIPLIWSPDPQQLNVLQTDWQELSDMVCLGEIQQLNAKIGQILQIRPKGANRFTLTSASNAEGETIATLPLGFYLRPCFTASIIAQYYQLNHL